MRLEEVTNQFLEKTEISNLDEIEVLLISWEEDNFSHPYGHKYLSFWFTFDNTDLYYGVNKSRSYHNSLKLSDVTFSKFSSELYDNPNKKSIYGRSHDAIVVYQLNPENPTKECKDYLLGDLKSNLVFYKVKDIEGLYDKFDISSNIWNSKNVMEFLKRFIRFGKINSILK